MLILFLTGKKFIIKTFFFFEKEKKISLPFYYTYCFNPGDDHTFKKSTPKKHKIFAPKNFLHVKTLKIPKIAWHETMAQVGVFSRKQ